MSAAAKEKTFTDAEKLKEVKDEIAFRWRVYARRVAEGKMTQTAMDRRIGLMQAIRDDYERRVQGRLF